MALSANAVQQLYLAYLGREADDAGLEYWTTQVPDSFTLEDLRNNLVNEQPEYQALYGDLDRQTLVETIYTNMFGRSADEAGLDYWVNGNGSVVPAEQLQQLFLEAASTADRDSFMERVNDATDGGDSENPGTTQALTVDQDALVGTDGDDTFTGYAFDNQNTLQTGDSIDGGAGTDTLKAMVGNSADFAISPITNSVEIAQFRAQANAIDSNGNDIGTSTLDVQDMVGTNEYWSVDSRSNLVIEDVRIESSQITEDVTIGMRSTDPSSNSYGDNQIDGDQREDAAGMEVYFSPDALRAAPDEASNSIANFDLLDLRAVGTDAPVQNLNVDGVSFDLEGYGTVTLQSQAILEAANYDELLSAFREALNNAQEQDSGLQGLSVDLSGQFQAINYAESNVEAGDIEYIDNAFGQTVSFTDADGRAISNPTITQDSSATAGFTLYSEPSIGAPQTTANLITSDVVLDDVGRGGQSGDLVIGSMNHDEQNSNVWDNTSAGSQGVEQFNVEVDRDSWISNMRSTGNTLQVVNVENTSDNNASGDGNLHIGGRLDTVDFGEEGNGDSTENKFGYLDAAAYGAVGLKDVQQFNASSFEGDVTLSAAITNEAVEKYMDLADTAGADADQVVFDYSTGAGDDTLNMQVDRDAVGVQQSAASVVDFEYTADTGAGDDTVWFQIGDDAEAAADNTNAAWYLNQKDNANITINTGAGDDVITTYGAGDAVINAGAGNDTVYTDNSGAQKGVYALNTSNTQLSDLNADLTAAQTGVGGTVQVSFKGFESQTIDIDFDADSDTTSILAINQAIKEAINTDPVLNKQLIAEDAAGGSTGLVIKSLTDGTLATGDLSIDFGQNSDVSLDGLTAFDASNVSTAYASTLATDDGGADIAGADSVVSSDNVINLGTGDDSVILSTSANSEETVVFTGTNNGVNTIVNFDDTGTGGTAGSAEVATVDFTGTSFTAGDDFVFGGQSFSLAGGGSLDAADLAAQLDGQSINGYTAADQGAGVIQFTADTDGDRTDVTAGDFSLNDNDGTGTDSVTANVVNVQQGTDATTGTDGADTLDFTSYFGDDDATQFSANAASAGFGDNTVYESDFGGFDQGVTFDNLTASDVAGALSGTNANAADAVWMIEDTSDAGSYKAFHISTADGSDDVSAELIGQIDFGGTVDLANNVA